VRTPGSLQATEPPAIAWLVDWVIVGGQIPMGESERAGVVVETSLLVA